MAKVPCIETLQFLEIAKMAGSSCDETIIFDGEYLTVTDVSQDALEHAFSSFNPLTCAKAETLTHINNAYESEFAAIKAQYPDSERESWPVQLSESAALADDAQAPTPFLDALLVARGFGETKAELAAKVQAKNLAYSTMSASLTGKRHRLERHVMDAETLEQVSGVIW